VRVGVLLPARNALPFIETMLTTVNAQTYPCAAYIVDDASDDGMTEFLKARPSWYRGHIVVAERRGWAGALNLAAGAALDDGCDAVFTAAADDFLRLDCIERCVRALARHDWVVPYSQQVGAENVVQVSGTNVVLEDFATWPPLTDKALFRREVWEAVGGYATDVAPPGTWGHKEDWEHWIRVWKAGFVDYGVVAEPVYYYRMHDAQLHKESENAVALAASVALIRAKHPDVWESAARRAQEAAPAAEGLVA
jgi:GT2 family glycosyltransferase